MYEKHVTISKLAITLILKSKDVMMGIEIKKKKSSKNVINIIIDDVKEIHLCYISQYNKQILNHEKKF